MDISALETLITSVGFPIVCVVALGWFVFKFYTDYTTDSKNRENRLMEFIKEEQFQMQSLVSTNAEFVEVLNVYRTDIETIKHDVSDIKCKIEERN